MSFDPHTVFHRPHPFDLAYGVQTSARITAQDLAPPDGMENEICGYEPVQPSVLRHAIETLPQALLPAYGFVDIGCGMGRGTMVAASFPFRDILGIDIAQQMAEAARENAQIYATKNPSATAIRIIEGNACDLPSVNGKSVLFLYNPFSRAMASTLLQTIENKLQNDIPHLFLIYHNPVAADMLDACPFLQRWSADLYCCDPNERNHGYKREGATVIWQSRKNAIPSPHKNATKQVRVRGHATRLRLGWFDVF